jgi:hypothetical protein
VLFRSADDPAAHGIEIGGNATLVASATYTVASEADAVGTLTMADEAVLTLGAGALLDGFNNTTDSAMIVLTGATGENGAKLDGEGTVVAGDTTIVGGTVGSAYWQAVRGDGVEEGDVTIMVDTITGATGVALKATGEDAAITVAAEGNLTLAENTTINLAGDSTAAGSIVLAKHATDPGKLSFGGTGAKVITANTTGADLTEPAGDFAASASPAEDKILVSAFSGTDYVTITGGNDTLKSIVFGGGTAYITGQKTGSAENVTIKSTTDCTT